MSDDSIAEMTFEEAVAMRKTITSFICDNCHRELQTESDEHVVRGTPTGWTNVHITQPHPPYGDTWTEVDLLYCDVCWQKNQVIDLENGALTPERYR